MFHFDYFCPTFLEEATTLLENLMTISARSDLNAPYNLLGGIFYCRRVTMFIQLLLLGGFILGSFSSLGYFSKKGSGVLGGDALTLLETYWEVFSLNYFIVVT